MGIKEIAAEQNQIKMIQQNRRRFEMYVRYRSGRVIAQNLWHKIRNNLLFYKGLW